MLFFVHCSFCDVGCCSSFIAFWRHLSPFCELSPGFYTHFILSAQLIAEWFATPSFWPFPAHLSQFYCECYRFEWVFFTHRRFLPYTPSPHFCHNLLLSRPLWEPAVLPWSLQASCWSSKHRPRPSICLIHSNPQSWYSEEFVFKLYQILSWITCGKKFSLSAPYSFQTLLPCSQSYVKTIKTTFNKTCTAYNRFDETAHRSYFEEAVTRKAAKRHIK